jgi:hypothetical protein
VTPKANCYILQTGQQVPPFSNCAISNRANANLSFQVRDGDETGKRAFLFFKSKSMIILPEKIEEEKPKQIRTKGKETTIKIVLQQFQKNETLEKKTRRSSTSTNRKRVWKRLVKQLIKFDKSESVEMAGD